MKNFDNIFAELNEMADFKDFGSAVEPKKPKVWVDNRQKEGKHDLKHQQMRDMGYELFEGYSYPFGDYSFIGGTTAVDTKFGLSEVYSCLVSDNVRFKAECVRARDAGIRLVILVEESGINSVEDVARWKNPRIEKYFKTKVAQSKGKMKNVRLAARPPVSSAQLAKTMQTFSERYGIEWQFCEKSETGKRILEILGNAVDV